MLPRYTAKELKELLKNVPDDALICCQSDEEGNSTMVTMGVFLEHVGKKTTEKTHGKLYQFTEGDNVMGVDLQTDKDKTLVIIRPMY